MAAPEKWWVVSLLNQQPVVVTGVTRQAVQEKYKGQFSFISGPFPTKAAADKFISTGRETGGSQSIPNAPASPLSGLSALGKIAHWIGDAVLHVTDAHMWISIGWLLLGALLVWIGIATWLKLPQKALKIAPLAAAL